MMQGSCEAPSVLAVPVIGQEASVGGAPSGTQIKSKGVCVKEELKTLKKGPNGKQETEQTIQ